MKLWIEACEDEYTAWGVDLPTSNHKNRKSASCQHCNHRPYIHVLLDVDAKDVGSETHVAESSNKKLNNSSSKVNPLNMSLSKTAVILFSVCNYSNV